MTQLVGRRLGHFEIQEEIGHGGMARVYRANDSKLRRPVAIKVLAPQLSLDPEFAQRFQREATTTASLRHPGIVTIYDIGEQDGFHYIAMELIRGRTLHTILEERGALGVGYAVSILDTLGQALDYAHRQGAVHRDVKPHNVMVDVDGRILLTDFGIALPPNEDGKRLTRTGIFMGTPEYMSPEQAEARRVDGRSDIYSLGIVAYEIITGSVPFSGATPQIIVAHAQTPPPPPSSIAAHLPEELDMVVAKALAKDPQRRYDSGAAMTAALRNVARRYEIPEATDEEIAALAIPIDSSVGQPTVSLGRGQTPVAAIPPAIQAQPTAQPTAPPAARPAASPRQPVGLPPSPRFDQRVAQPPPQPQATARSSMTGQSGTALGRSSVSWMPIIWSLAGVVFVGLLVFFVLNSNGASRPMPLPSPTPPLSAPATAEPPTATFTATPTDLPSPTVEPPTATAPPPPPTSPPVPATATLPPPPPTLAPTLTPPPVPPSATPTLTTTPAPPTLTAPPPPSATPTLAPTLTVTPTLTPTLNTTSAVTPTLTGTLTLQQTFTPTLTVAPPPPTITPPLTIMPSPSATPTITPTETVTPSPLVRRPTEEPLP